jgi:hypothetical protein
MPEAARWARDLFSVAHVLTVDEDPPSLRSTDDEELVGAYRQALADLEGRYGLSTAEIIRRLFDREPVELPEEDLNRWTKGAEALRGILGE